MFHCVWVALLLKSKEAMADKEDAAQLATFIRHITYFAMVDIVRPLPSDKPPKSKRHLGQALRMCDQASSIHPFTF
jgi:hypothetical protein